MKLLTACLKALGEAGTQLHLLGGPLQETYGIECSAFELFQRNQLILPKYVYCLAEVLSYRGLYNFCPQDINVDGSDAVE